MVQFLAGVDSYDLVVRMNMIAIAVRRLDVDAHEAENRIKFT